MKRLSIVVLLLAALSLLAACTTTTPPQPSPSPSVSPALENTLTPELSPTADLATSPSPGATARPVATGARIEVNGNTIVGAPYYDAEDEMVFPIKTVAEALGWQVEVSASGAAETLLITKSGQEDVTVTYTKPGLGQNMATGVTAKKGQSALNLDNTQVFAENMLYAPEAFFDSALEDVDVQFNGTNVVTIAPAG